MPRLSRSFFVQTLGLTAFMLSATAIAQTPAPPATATPADAALRAAALEVFSAIPTTPPTVREQPVSPAMAELGKMLFFEPRLSRSHIITCNTCHSLSTGGSDNIPTSIGHGFMRGPRNAPTVYNAVFNAAQFWDGRAANLREQAKGPVQASVEMNSTPERVVQTLNSIPEYVAAFRTAFPAAGGNAVSFDNMALAIESFEATLITPNAPFDRYLNGDNAALTAEQKTGLHLFMERGCSTCHSGVNLGGQAYFPFGVAERPGARILPDSDKGRFAVTQTEGDEFAFRAGPLRNIALTAPYFHSGQVWDLREAVAIMGSSQLGIQLSDADATAITAFLNALTAPMPTVTMPELPPSTATTPRPE